MEYSKQDFLETAGPQTLKQIAKTRELTRKYNQIEHSDTEARTALLRELFGAIGENVEIDTPFYCDHGKNIFIGNDVIINISLPGFCWYQAAAAWRRRIRDQLMKP